MPWFMTPNRYSFERCSATIIACMTRSPYSKKDSFIPEEFSNDIDERLFAMVEENQTEENDEKTRNGAYH
jgi:hypothetical protein